MHDALEHTENNAVERGSRHRRAVKPHPTQKRQKSDQCRKIPVRSVCSAAGHMLRPNPRRFVTVPPQRQSLIEPISAGKGTVSTSTRNQRWDSSAVYSQAFKPLLPRVRTKERPISKILGSSALRKIFTPFFECRLRFDFSFGVTSGTRMTSQPASHKK